MFNGYVCETEKLKLTEQTRIVLTGATGLMGRYLATVIGSFENSYFLGYTNKLESHNYVSLDLSKRELVLKCFKEIRPELIIHTVALTDVDENEVKPHKAYEINVLTTKNIVKWIKEYSSETKLVYISTDQVYGGEGEHCEEIVRPSNVYALTKLWAESIVQQATDYLILRSSFYAIGKPERRGFVDWLILSLNQKKPITLFNDVFFNPLYIKEFLEILLWLIEHDIGGIYNIGSSGGGISKAQFAMKLAEVFQLEYHNATVGSIESGTLKAFRPKDMRMSVKKIEMIMKKPVPRVREGLEKLYIDWKSVECRRD